MNAANQVSRPKARSPTRIGTVSRRSPVNHWEQQGLDDKRKKKKENIKIRIGSLNVGSMTGKGTELAKMMVERRVKICCVQETKWTGGKARELGEGVKLWYAGGRSAKNGVGIAVEGEMREEVTGVIRQSDRLMGMKIGVGKERWFVVSCYAPQSGLSAEEKEKFYEDLSELCTQKEEEEVLVVCGDFNGHIGRDGGRWRGVHRGEGYGTRNEEGERLLDWATDNSIVIANSTFKKRNSHKITYSSGGRNTQIDYIGVEKEKAGRVLDCKVIPNAAVASQHLLLVMDYRVKRSKERKTKETKEKVIKWWDMKKDRKSIDFAKEVSHVKIGDSAENTWEELKNGVRKAGIKVLGETRIGGKRPIRDESYWNDEVEEAVKKKKEARNVWWKEQTDEKLAAYREKKRNAKRIVAEAKAKTMNNLYEELGTKEGEKKIFKLAKMRNRRSKDVQAVKIVRDKEGKILYDEEKIKERWREHFEGMANIHFGMNEPYDSDAIEGPMDQIHEDEVREAVKKSKKGKAMGPDEVPADALKYMGEVGVKTLTTLFNQVIKEGKMPRDWTRSTTIPIYKKSDPLQVENYRPVRLLSHTMKIFERVLEKRLRKILEISSAQFGFIPCSSTTDAIFALTQTMEKYREKRKKLHLAFIDLKSAFDSVERTLIANSLREKGVHEDLVKAVMLTYEDAKSEVKTTVGRTKTFEVGVGTHQGSTLSPLLFISVMDTVTKGIQKSPPYTLMYADDVVLLCEDRKELEEWTEEWRKRLEGAGMKMNVKKTEYMETGEQEDGSIVVGGVELPKTTVFTYLGCRIDSDGGYEEAMEGRIQSGWMKWKETTGVTCDRRMPMKLKGKIYRSVTRPALMYGGETFAQTAAMDRRMGTVEMRMLRMQIGVTRMDRWRNEDVRKKLGVAPITEKMRESRLRWYGHVERREDDSILKIVTKMEVEGKRARGRPKLRWKDTIEKDLKETGTGKALVIDRNTWKRCIHVADPVT